MIAGARFSRERMRPAASDELIAATDVADLLVRLGLPFREAHGVVAGLVRTALEQAGHCRQLTAAELGRAQRGRWETRTEEYYAGARSRAPGWSPRSRRVAPPWRACGSSWSWRGAPSRRKSRCDAALGG